MTFSSLYMPNIIFKIHVTFWCFQFSFCLKKSHIWCVSVTTHILVFDYDERWRMQPEPYGYFLFLVPYVRNRILQNETKYLTENSSQTISFKNKSWMYQIIVLLVRNAWQLPSGCQFSIKTTKFILFCQYVHIQQVQNVSTN